jgi:hypothetical protein
VRDSVINEFDTIVRLDIVQFPIVCLLLDDLIFSDEIRDYFFATVENTSNIESCVIEKCQKVCVSSHDSDHELLILGFWM